MSVVLIQIAIVKKFDVRQGGLLITANDLAMRVLCEFCGKTLA